MWKPEQSSFLLLKSQLNASLHTRRGYCSLNLYCSYKSDKWLGISSWHWVALTTNWSSGFFLKQTKKARFCKWDQRTMTSAAPQKKRHPCWRLHHNVFPARDSLCGSVFLHPPASRTSAGSPGRPTEGLTRFPKWRLWGTSHWAAGAAARSDTAADAFGGIVLGGLLLVASLWGSFLPAFSEDVSTRRINGKPKIKEMKRCSLRTDEQRDARPAFGTEAPGSNLCRSKESTSACYRKYTTRKSNGQWNREKTHQGPQTGWSLMVIHAKSHLMKFPANSFVFSILFESNQILIKKKNNDVVT